MKYIIPPLFAWAVLLALARPLQAGSETNDQSNVSVSSRSHQEALPLQLAQAPVPAPPLPQATGPLDTNVFNTNGLAVPPDVKLLIQDLRVNLDQLNPFLSIMTGEAPSNSPATGAPPPQPPPSLITPPATGTGTNTNGAPLVYAVGGILENVQADLDALLPRLATMVGHTNYSGYGGGGDTNLPSMQIPPPENNSPFPPPLSNSIAPPLTNAFAPALTNGFAPPLNQAVGKPSPPPSSSAQKQLF
ncbi:MAG: hypothetical protein JWR26_2657 [Pedosphaera sp.]|nr:hypothetical protein [Pedosphaera sp.]